MTYYSKGIMCMRRSIIQHDMRERLALYYIEATNKEQQRIQRIVNTKDVETFIREKPIDAIVSIIPYIFKSIRAYLLTDSILKGFIRIEGPIYDVDILSVVFDYPDEIRLGG